MLVSAQHDFRITALDRGVLSTPFRFHTNWHVITGAQSSGKTPLAVDVIALNRV